SIASGGSFWRRLGSREGYTSVSHIFVMEWAAVIRDVVLGLLIAGAVGAWGTRLVLAAPVCSGRWRSRSWSCSPPPLARQQHRVLVRDAGRHAHRVHHHPPGELVADPAWHQGNHVSRAASSASGRCRYPGRCGTRLRLSGAEQARYYPASA